MLRRYLSPVSRAAVPVSNAAVARASHFAEASSSALWYCGITSGPGGALGFVNGWVFSQAAKAGLNSSRNRFSNAAAVFWLPAVTACSQNEKVVES